MDVPTFVSRMIDSLAWPVVVLFMVSIFRRPLTALIGRIKSLNWRDLNIDFNDTVQLLSPTGEPARVLKVEPPAAQKVEISARLSAQEIEGSRKTAQARLDEDTKKAGYQRGKLFQLPNGAYAIAWEVVAQVHIGIH